MRLRTVDRIALSALCSTAAVALIVQITTPRGVAVASAPVASLTTPRPPAFAGDKAPRGDAGASPSQMLDATPLGPAAANGEPTPPPPIPAPTRDTAGTATPTSLTPHLRDGTSTLQPTPTPSPYSPSPPASAPVPNPQPVPPPNTGSSPAGTPVAPGAVRDIITAAATRHAVDPARMIAIAQCESSLNPLAVNPAGPYEGLFQFLPSTFAAHGGADIWDPAQQADIAASMVATGRASAFGCS